MLGAGFSILDAWFSIIRKSVNIPDKSGYCFKKTTIHFAHYVRSVAATHRPTEKPEQAWLTALILLQENGAYTESISISPEMLQDHRPANLAYHTDYGYGHSWSSDNWTAKTA